MHSQAETILVRLFMPLECPPHCGFKTNAPPNPAYPDFGTLVLLCGVLHGCTHMALTINEGQAEGLLKKPLYPSGMLGLAFIVPTALPMLLPYLKKLVSSRDRLFRVMSEPTWSVITSLLRVGVAVQKCKTRYTLCQRSYQHFT